MFAQLQIWDLGAEKIKRTLTGHKSDVTVSISAFFAFPRFPAGFCYQKFTSSWLEAYFQ